MTTGNNSEWNAAIEAAAKWHDEEAEQAKRIYSGMCRYSDDAEERSGWRSYKDKDKEDRHRAYAHKIRSLLRGEAQQAPNGECR